MLAYISAPTNRISRGGGSIIIGSAGGATYNVPTGTTHAFQVNAVNVETIAGGSVTFAQPIILPDGTAAAAAIQKTGAAGTGLFFDGNNLVHVVGGTKDTSIGSSVGITSIGKLGFSASTGDQALDAYFQRAGVGIIKQEDGATAQEMQWYGILTNSTNYQRLALRFAVDNLTGLTGATVTSSNLIPDGAVVVGLTTRVNVALGTTNSTTGYQVGDGTDPDRWGAITGTAIGTGSHNADWTATTIQAFTAANSVVLTAVGGNFDGTGAIQVRVAYFIGEFD